MAESTADKIARERTRLAGAIPSSVRLSPDFLDRFSGSSDVSQVPERSGLLSAEELKITQLDAVDLRDAIASKKISAVNAVTAFAKRAAIAQQLTCCLSDLFVEEAIAQARKLDEYQAKTGKVVGPLHGVPVSFKEHIELAGRPAAAAAAAWIDDIPTSDAHMIRLLRSAGAVFYCKTMMPQTGMHVETHSFYGRTLNPFNTALSAGGSSGGEGALVAMKGSVLGLGSDIGGSIRLPAGNCGLWGLKPTHDILPVTGFRNYTKGATAIPLVCGPIASSRKSLALFMSSLVSQSPHLENPSLVPVPQGLYSFDTLCRPPKLDRKLRIGVMHHDGVVRPCPPVVRAMKWMEDRLRKSNTVEVVELEPFQPGKTQRLAVGLLAADGQDVAKAILGDEEWTPLTKKVLGKSAPPIPVRELYKLTTERDQFRLDFAKYWNDKKIDLLLCPAAHSPAPPHDTSGYVAYTVLFNILGYPGAVFPTGLRVEKIDVKDSTHKPFNKLDRILQDAWDPVVSLGAPLGLQLVSKPWTDDFLLSSLAVIEDVISR